MGKLVAVALLVLALQVGANTVSHHEKHEKHDNRYNTHRNCENGKSPFCTPREVEVPTVPIPGALWLLGSGVAVFIYLGRRKK